MLLTPQDFVSKWKRVTAREKQTYQEHFIDLCHWRDIKRRMISIRQIWALKQGTALEDRPRYTPTTSFETFPFPWAPGKEPKDDPRVQAIAQAAKELVEQRDRWLNAEGLSEAEKKKRTLTNLYNARPTWLDPAHKRLEDISSRG